MRLASRRPLAFGLTLGFPSSLVLVDQGLHLPDAALSVLLIVAVPVSPIKMLVVLPLLHSLPAILAKPGDRVMLFSRSGAGKGCCSRLQLRPWWLLGYFRRSNQEIPDADSRPVRATL